MNWPNQLAQRARRMRRSAVRELLKLTAQPEMISFAGGLPAPELFPVADLQAATNRLWHTQPHRALQYGETEGIGELRDWIAEDIARRQGIAVTRNNLLIVSGAQQGLDLLGRVLIDEEDGVIVENPTYLALLSAWRPVGARFLAAASDDDGVRIDSVESLLPQKPKLVYCVPNFQNPQGTTLSTSRRRQLVRLAQEHDFGIVEDDPYGALRFDGAHEPSLLSLSVNGGKIENSPVIQVGTFSKVLAPGLRIGWILASSDLIEKLGCAKQAMDLHTSTLNQWLVLETIRSGCLTAQLPRLIAAYRERRDAMLAALDEYLRGCATWTSPAGGMFLMLKFGGGVNARELLARTIEQKVAFVPGEEFHLNGEGTDTARLNFSNANPERIREGIRRLAGCLCTSA